MKKSYPLLSLISFLSFAQASELLVPSLQDESWVRGPAPLLKAEKFPTPLEQEPYELDIPREITLEPVILVDAHGEIYEIFVDEGDIPSSPQIEPEIREAIEKEKTQPLQNEEESRFLQTDIFFSIQFDYAQTTLSDDNKNIANQIVKDLQKDNTQRLEIITAKETTGAAKLKTSEFIRYLKDAGIDSSQITVSLAEKEQAALLQDHTILAIIKQFSED